MLKYPLSLLLIILLCCLPSSKTFAQKDSLAGLKQIEQSLATLGLSFTLDEIRMMEKGVFRQIRSYEALRAYPMSNSVRPALIFNPFPYGMIIPPLTEQATSWPQEQIPRPELEKDIAFMSIPELAFLIENRKISSLELTNLYLQRLKTHDKDLHCVVNLTEEYAIRMAIQADQEIADGNYRGILHGIPYGVKDLLAFPDMPTTWGAMPYKNQNIEETATVIRRLEEAGAILVGKLTLGALAMGDIWFGGTTKNPWNLKQGSSGSSAGPASAVAAGLVPFAIGSETLGSIVSPSTRCAVTGLRPGFGRVSKHGAMALSWTMDKLGPICRSSLDCAIVFNAIHGKDPFDPSALDAEFVYPKAIDFHKQKVAYLEDAFSEDYGFKKNDQQVLRKLEKLGVELIPIKLPDGYPIQALRIILNAEAASAFSELTLSDRDSLLVNQGAWAWPNTFRSARLIPAVEYIHANRIRTELIVEVNNIFQDYDLIICPSYVGNQLTMTNLTGHPALLIPTGFDKKSNPTSITLLANHFKEGLLCAAGQVIQKELGLYLNRPPLFDQ